MQKYLNYCKSLHLTKVLRWRKMVLTYKMGSYVKNKLKLNISLLKQNKSYQLHFHEDKEAESSDNAEGGSCLKPPKNKYAKPKYTKEYKKLGDTINVVFPMLDPDFE